ncbi:MAG TPA: response regulator, partial [bacterium]|nr:response regulator [bacterium]
NARDAMPDGGTLLIETANIDLDEDYCRRHTNIQPGKYIRLTVGDTGCGMNEEVKRHLFEPFFTTKPLGHGTGLGLATIYGAIKQAGGNIEVYSEENVGTAFKIYLPCLGGRSRTAAQTKAASSEMPAGHETIMLVEDDNLVRGLAHKVLVRLGYHVLVADHGLAALELAKGYLEKIDLLLTDVVMPGMNGQQLAEKLLLIHPEMKVVFTSGYTEDAIVHHGVLNEGLHFIGKPYSPQSLAQKIRNVLDG